MKYHTLTIVANGESRSMEVRLHPDLLEVTQEKLNALRESGTIDSYAVTGLSRPRPLGVDGLEREIRGLLHTDEFELPRMYSIEFVYIDDTHQTYGTSCLMTKAEAKQAEELMDEASNIDILENPCVFEDPEAGGKGSVIEALEAAWNTQRSTHNFKDGDMSAVDFSKGAEETDDDFLKLLDKFIGPEEGVQMEMPDGRRFVCGVSGFPLEESDVAAVREAYDEPLFTRFDFCGYNAGTKSNVFAAGEVVHVGSLMSGDWYYQEDSKK